MYTSKVCFSKSISISHRSRVSHRGCRNGNTRFLIYPLRFSQSQTRVASGLWNCRSAVQKADLISALASFHLLHFLPLTEILLRSLPCLPVTALVIFKTLMLACKAKNGSAPLYLMAINKTRAVPRALGARSTARLDPPSLTMYGRQASRPFSVLAPRWWNERQLAVPAADSVAVFKHKPKTQFFMNPLSKH